MSTVDKPAASSDVWLAARSDPEFVLLRRRFRLFVLPISALFLAWYLAYVLLADYAHEFMSTKLAGNITVGLVLGLGQFVSTFLITTLYVRYANRRLDPLAESVRERIESADEAGQR